MDEDDEPELLVDDVAANTDDARVRVRRRRPEWNLEEEAIVTYCHCAMGNKWAEISEALGHRRTAGEVKNIWHSTARSKTKVRTFLRAYVHTLRHRSGDAGARQSAFRLAYIRHGRSLGACFWDKVLASQPDGGMRALLQPLMESGARGRAGIKAQARQPARPPQPAGPHSATALEGAAPAHPCHYAAPAPARGWPLEGEVPAQSRPSDGAAAARQGAEAPGRTSGSGLHRRGSGTPEAAAAAAAAGGAPELDEAELVAAILAAAGIEGLEHMLRAARAQALGPAPGGGAAHGRLAHGGHVRDSSFVSSGLPYAAGEPGMGGVGARRGAAPVHLPLPGPGARQELEERDAGWQPQLARTMRAGHDPAARGHHPYGGASGLCRVGSEQPSLPGSAAEGFADARALRVLSGGGGSDGGSEESLRGARPDSRVQTAQRGALAPYLAQPAIGLSGNRQQQDLCTDDGGRPLKIHLAPLGHGGGSRGCWPLDELTMADSTAAYGSAADLPLPSGQHRRAAADLPPHYRRAGSSAAWPEQPVLRAASSACDYPAAWDGVLGGGGSGGGAQPEPPAASLRHQPVAERRWPAAAPRPAAAAAAAPPQGLRLDLGPQDTARGLAMLRQMMELGSDR